MSSSMYETPAMKKRVRLLIYPRFQLTLVAVNAGIMLATIAIVWFQISRSFSHLYGLGVEAGLRPAHPFYEFLTYQKDSMSVYLVTAFTIGFLVSSFAMLALSHRLAGPILRMRGHFQRIAEGERPIPKLSFREHDFFDELPPLVNQALESLQKSDGDKKSDAA